MKKLLSIGLLVCLVFLGSCDKKATGLISLEEAYCAPQKDFYLAVELSKGLTTGNLALSVNIVSKYALESLALNELPIPVYQVSHNISYGSYSYFFSVAGIDIEDIGGFDQEISYKIVFEHKSVGGSLRMPPEYFCDAELPDNAEDYELSWNLADHPKAQSISFDILTGSGNYLFYKKELQPSRRDFGLSRTKWSNHGELYRFHFELSASNYDYTQGGLVWYISSAYATWIDIGEPE